MIISGIKTYCHKHGDMGRFIYGALAVPLPPPHPTDSFNNEIMLLGYRSSLYLIFVTWADPDTHKSRR